MGDLVGKSVLHYRIIEQIGRGCMGVVYKAEDTKLERSVAIKCVSHNLAFQVLFSFVSEHYLLQNQR